MLIDIRDAFFEELYKKIKKDKKIILITVDQGAHTLIKLKKIILKIILILVYLNKMRLMLLQV